MNRFVSNKRKMILVKCIKNYSYTQRIVRIDFMMSIGRKKPLIKLLLVSYPKQNAVSLEIIYYSGKILMRQT